MTKDEIKHEIFDLMPSNGQSRGYSYITSADGKSWKFKFGGVQGPEFGGSADDDLTLEQRMLRFLVWLKAEWPDGYKPLKETHAPPA